MKYTKDNIIGVTFNAGKIADRPAKYVVVDDLQHPLRRLTDGWKFGGYSYEAIANNFNDGYWTVMDKPKKDLYEIY